MRLIGTAVKPLGFMAQGAANWHRVRSDLYSIVNLQQSGWADSSYYINLGFSPAETVSDAWIPESKCMIRFRIEAIKAIDSTALDILDEGAVWMDEIEFESILGRDVLSPLVQFLERIDDSSALGRLLNSDVPGRVFIHKDAGAILGHLG